MAAIHRIQLALDATSFSSLNVLKEVLDFTTVTAVVRKALATLHFLSDQVRDGYQVVLVKGDTSIPVTRLLMLGGARESDRDEYVESDALASSREVHRHR